MPAREALNVLDVRPAGDGESCGLDPADAELQSIRGHDFGSLSVQVINEAGNTEYPLRNFCLELRFAGENDNRLDGAGRQKVKEGLDRPNMSRTLEYWVLKLELP